MNINGPNSNITIQEYWRRVREIQRGLPDVVHLVSTPDPRVSENNRSKVQFTVAESLIAAQCIFSGTHRIATEDEIVAQEKKREINLLETVRRNLAAQGIVSITLPDKTSE